MSIASLNADSARDACLSRNATRPRSKAARACEYECTGCRRVSELKQRISEAPRTSCDACGGPVRRLLSAAPFILKGDGWYVTDYPSASRKKAREAETKGTSTDSSPTPAPAARAA